MKSHYVRNLKHAVYRRLRTSVVASPATTATTRVHQAEGRGQSKSLVGLVLPRCCHEVPTVYSGSCLRCTVLRYLPWTWLPMFINVSRDIPAKFTRNFLRRDRTSAGGKQGSGSKDSLGYLCNISYYFTSQSGKSCIFFYVTRSGKRAVMVR